MSIQQGSILAGKYEVVRAITSGGMGSIYEARVLGDKNIRVALKQMMQHLMEGEQAAMFKSKFRSEVEFLRSLTHPGIPKLYDAFVDDGLYYIAMEFIIGRNLDQEREERQHLTGETVPVMQLIHDTRQVLDILHYLHNQKPPLVHRDIKPANLIREHPSGRIKLVDFGLARFLSEGNQTQTQIGTLGYSPIEQLRGKAEQRSDIYALGATMFHLVTGKCPEAMNIPPVLTLKPDLNPALAAIIDRACAMEIDVRFGSAKDMLRDLESLLPETPEPSFEFQSLPRLDEENELRTFTSADRGKGRPKRPIPALAPDFPPVPPTPPPPRSEEREKSAILTQDETVRVDVSAMVAATQAQNRRRIVLRRGVVLVVIVFLAWLFLQILARSGPSS